MDTTLALGLGITALLLAAVLYFIFLPHIDGPSLADQQADATTWLVECPHCHHWKPRTPTTTAENDQPHQRTNWYHCHECGHRWHETYPN